MGQNQRRPGFLRWGESARGDDADAGADAAAPVTPDESPVAEAAAADAAATDATAPDAAAPAEATAEPAPDAEQPAAAATAEDAAPPDATYESDENPFLRDLVGAMRGVADASRETTVAEFKSAVDARTEELKTAATQRADDLRRRSELDLGGIGDWERSELERVRGEAEQRRKARRELLEKELAEHQGASDQELEALNARLADYERELEAFFAKLSDITDPGEFVATAKQMPAPPDISGTADAGAKPAGSSATANGNGATPAVEDRLAKRLAQLDEKLGTATAPAAAAEASEAAATEPAPAPAEEAAPAAAVEQAAAEMPTPATPPAEAAAPAVAAATATATATAAPPPESSTPIVVKGLGSFGAITSFKQALERVGGIHGVTLSLGPTGDFVYRASHAGDFDLVAAIRSIEGPNAEIEEVDGQLRVSIERPR